MWLLRDFGYNSGDSREHKNDFVKLLFSHIFHLIHASRVSGTLVWTIKKYLPAILGAEIAEMLLKAAKKWDIGHNSDIS